MEDRPTVTDHPPASPALPAWVKKRDGRLVPFEADKISRALFAAAESLGRPDPFLARELTDGIVHFLVSDVEGVVPTTAQIADLTVKVVRELGQPALAAAFAEGQQKKDKRLHLEPGRADPRAEIVVRLPADKPPCDAVRACLRGYTLQTVFTRDLVAAGHDGLLTLTGLEAPLELAGCVLERPSISTEGRQAGGAGLVETIEAARLLAGSFVALDGPEHSLALADGGDGTVVDYVRELGIGLRATGLAAVVNLNCAVPPAWADDLAEGPLFAGLQRTPEPRRLSDLADGLLDHLLRSAPNPDRLRVDWHLAERDFQPEGRERLLALARRAIEGAALAFTFDRPRRPVHLAEGLDRRHPAVLLAVGLHLPALVRQVGAGGEPAVFLQKLGSLARLALAAAVQKRDFLRRHSQDRPALTRGFLLDRARLAAAPIGLSEVARALGGASPDIVRQTVQTLRDVLRHDGGACRLETCLDNLREDLASGLTAWDGTVPVKEQLRTAGVLQGVAETGTAAVLVPEGRLPAPEQVADWLRWAWQRTEVVRVRLLRVAEPHRQLTFG
jgi:hypothetical protein